MNEESRNLKRSAIMKTGRRLFWKYGFRRVSVDEICKEACISKMTFYRYFDNKTALAKSIFDEITSASTIKFKEILCGDFTPAEKLRKILIMKVDNSNDVSQEFITDFYNSPDSELQKYIKDMTTKSWNEMIETFRLAQRNGWFRKDFKPEFLFFVSQKIVQMLSDEELLKLYDNPQDLIMEFANFFTYGISPHE